MQSSQGNWFENNFTLTAEEMREKYGQAITVKREGYQDVQVTVNVLSNNYLRKYSKMGENTIHLYLVDQTTVEKFYDTLFLCAPICWFLHKASSFLESISMEDLPSKLWSLVKHKKVKKLDTLIPNFYKCNYSGYDGYTGEEDDSLENPPGIAPQPKDNLEAQSFLSLLEEYPIFLEKQDILLKLLLLPELYPCTKRIASMYIDCGVKPNIHALRKFHSLSLAHEVGLIAEKKKCLFLPINHPFYSVTTATSEDIRYLLVQIVGQWFAEIDLSKTSLTGSIISCAIDMLIHDEEQAKRYFSYYLSYNANIDFDGLLPKPGTHDYANSAIIYQNRSYPILPDADVDLAIDVETDVELLQEAVKHYKVIKKYYPSSVLQEITTNNKHIKYKVTTTDTNDYVLGFRDIDMYISKATKCQDHHVAPVRAYYGRSPSSYQEKEDELMIYAIQSCVDCHVSRKMKEYRLHLGIKTPADVLCKYGARCFSQSFLPSFISSDILYHDVIGHVIKRVDKKVLKICTKSVYPKQNCLYGEDKEKDIMLEVDDMIIKPKDDKEYKVVVKVLDI